MNEWLIDVPVFCLKEYIFELSAQKFKINLNIVNKQLTISLPLILGEFVLETFFI